MLRYFVALKYNVTSGTPSRKSNCWDALRIHRILYRKTYIAYESDIAETAPITLYML